MNWHCKHVPIIYAVLTVGSREELDFSKSTIANFFIKAPPNEGHILIANKKKMMPSYTLYQEEFTLQKNLSIRGFTLYLVQTAQRTTLVAFTERMLGSTRKTRWYRKIKTRKRKVNSGNVSKRSKKKLETLDKAEFRKLHNIYKNSSYVYETPNKNINTVISSNQFVFKPEIPINVINYPLYNLNKCVIIQPEKQVDKILSYGLSDQATRKYSTFPSVSNIIAVTISDKSKQVLAHWRRKLVVDLGENGFYNYSEALKARGTEFHMAVRNAILGETIESCSEVTRNGLKSLAWVLKHITSPVAVESTIAHPILRYRGVVDCIALFRNIPVIIDWKLSEKPKRYLKDTFDAPVQITAYIAALNYDTNYQWRVNHGLVAVAYTNGDPCDVFLLAPKHCEIYWRHWLLRLEKFKTRSHLHLDHDIDEEYLQQI